MKKNFRFILVACLILIIGICLMHRYKIISDVLICAGLGLILFSLYLYNKENKRNQDQTRKDNAESLNEIANQLYDNKDRNEVTRIVYECYQNEKTGLNDEIKNVGFFHECEYNEDNGLISLRIYNLAKNTSAKFDLYMYTVANKTLLSINGETYQIYELSKEEIENIIIDNMKQFKPTGPINDFEIKLVERPIRNLISFTIISILISLINLICYWSDNTNKNQLLVVFGFSIIVFLVGCLSYVALKSQCIRFEQGSLIYKRFHVKPIVYELNEIKTVEIKKISNSSYKVSLIDNNYSTMMYFCCANTVISDSTFLRTLTSNNIEIILDEEALMLGKRI